MGRSQEIWGDHGRSGEIAHLRVEEHAIGHLLGGVVAQAACRAAALGTVLA